MWNIEAKYELAYPTVGSYIWSRFAMVLEHILLAIPLVLLIVKVMEWSGNYVSLVFLLTTGLVKFAILWIYPKVIMPLFASYEDLPSYTDCIREQVKIEAKKVGCNPDTIKMERSFQYDVHSNASTVLGNITLGLPLFKVHGCRPAEILAILTHELGHYKLAHLTWSAIVDTAYMLVFGLIMTLLINDATFLKSFGFYKQSFSISFYLFTYIYLYSIDVPIRIGMRVISRVHEY